MNAAPSVGAGRNGADAPVPAFATPPRELCIVMMSAIGDAVHVLPVVSALRRAWPETRITWVIQPLAHRLVYNHPAVDEFLLFHRMRGLRAWEGFHRFRRELPEKRFDLLLALQVYLKAGILTGLIPARTKLGFDRRRARDLNWLFTNERVPRAPFGHVQDHYFEFLHYLGVDPEPVTWDIVLTGAEREAQADFFARFDRPACAVVLGSTAVERMWRDPEGYGRVLEEIQFTHGLQPVLVGGPSRQEREMADAVLAATRADPVDTLGDDLRRLVYLIEGSAMTLSPDTGPLHISRAVDTPVVGLYGYSNPKRAGPYRKFGELVVDGYARYEGEEYDARPDFRDGMKRITVERVLEKVELCVERYVRGGR